MVQTKTPPFCADHVASLLRPPALLAAREDEKNGRISPADLRRIEDQAIREVVAQQEDLGLEGQGNKNTTDGVEDYRELWM
jgi:5-methyltetrahydropteroyltriglutamate--homocysteine methyltransferase